MVASGGINGDELRSYPVTQTIHADSILYVTETPADVSQETHDRARQLAEKAVACLEGMSPRAWI